MRCARVCSLSLPSIAAGAALAAARRRLAPELEDDVRVHREVGLRGHPVRPLALRLVTILRSVAVEWR